MELPHLDSRTAYILWSLKVGVGFFHETSLINFERQRRNLAFQQVGLQPINSGNWPLSSSVCSGGIWPLSRSFGSGGTQAIVIGLSRFGIQGEIWSTLLARNLGQELGAILHHNSTQSCLPHQFFLIRAAPPRRF